MTRVKICGITRLADAMASAEAGAWAIGLIFSRQSPRFVTAAKANAAIAQLPKSVLRVGVFMNQSLEVIRRVEAEVPLDLIQLHGRETDDLCVQIGKERCIKAFVLRDDTEVARACGYSCDFVMADRPRGSVSIHPLLQEDKPVSAEWEFAAKLAAKRSKTLLAGGLTPENVADGIHAVHPWGVDVSSSLESEPGIKDAKKVKAFVSAARAADGATK